MSLSRSGADVQNRSGAGSRARQPNTCGSTSAMRDMCSAVRSARACGREASSTSVTRRLSMSSPGGVEVEALAHAAR